MKTKSQQKAVPKEVEGTCYAPKDLAKVDPKKEQFEPTTASPIPQHQKMAGVC